MSQCTSRASRRRLQLAVASAALVASSLAHGASGSWVLGDLGSSWSIGTNWSGGSAPTTAEEGILGDVTTGTRVVAYDTASSGALGTLTIQQTSAAINVLELQRALTITNAVVLGAAAGGLTEFRIAPSTASLTATLTGGLTLNANSQLTFGFGGPTTQFGSTLAGTVNVNGGAIVIAPQATAVGGSGQSVINGSLNFSSGTVLFNTNNGTFDARLQINNNFTATGGTFTVGAGTNGLGTGQFFLGGAVNSIGGTAFIGPKVNFTLSGNTQSLSSSVAIGDLSLRGGTGSVKTITVAPAVGGNVGAITIFNPTPTGAGTQTLLLGSNLTVKSGSAQANLANFGNGAGTTLNFSIDTAGYTLDLTNALTGAAPFQPRAINATQTSTLTLQGNGVIRAANFIFNSSNTTATTGGYTPVVIGPGITLEATGGNGTAIALNTQFPASNVIPNAAGTFVPLIDPTATILYSGNAAAATPALIRSFAQTSGTGSLAFNLPNLAITGGGVLRNNFGNMVIGGNLNLSNGTLVLADAAGTVAQNFTVFGTTTVGTGTTLGGTTGVAGISLLTLDGPLTIVNNTSETALTRINFATAAFTPINTTFGTITLGTAATPAASNVVLALSGTTFLPAITASQAGRVIDLSQAAGGAGSPRTRLIYLDQNTLNAQPPILLGQPSGTSRIIELSARTSLTTAQYSGTISDNGTPAAGLVINGGGINVGRVQLSQSGSSFTAPVTVSNGFLYAANSVNNGTFSPLGNSTTPITLGDAETPSNATGDTGNPAVMLNTGFSGSFSRAINLGNAATTAGGNGSANSYIVGGVQTQQSSFFGAITVTSSAANKLLNLTAPAGGTAIFNAGIGANPDAVGVLGVTINAGGGLGSPGNSYPYTSIANNAGFIDLRGSNTYDGATVVRQGTLRVANTTGSATGGGQVTVNSGATLTGPGTIGGGINAVSGAILEPGAIGPVASIGTLTAGTASLNGASINFDATAAGFDKINLLGSLLASGTNTLTLNDPSATAVNGLYTLIDYTGTALADLTAFTLATATLNGQPVTLVNNTGNTSIDLQLGPVAAINQYNLTVGANYSGATTFSQFVPNGVDAVANFLAIPTSPVTVNIDVPVTVGTIKFDNANRYTLSGSNTITVQTTSGSGGLIDLVSGSHTISAPLSLVSGTTIQGAGTLTAGAIANAAALSVNTNVLAGTITGTGSTSVAASKLLQTTGITQASLTLAAGGKATVTAGRSTAKTSKIGTLTATGVLDLNDNDAVFTSTSAATIRAALVSGSTLGTYAGTAGITSSTAATASGSGTPTALAYALASDIGSPTTFAGLTGINPTDVLVKYTLAGDANLDGTVDTVDFAKLIGGFASATSWVGGDFNYSGATNSTDFNLLVANYGKTAAPSALPGSLPGDLPAAPAGAPGAVVPEPATLGLLGAGLLMVKRRRR